QTARMIVDPPGSRRVQLHHRLFLVPKVILDETHLRPIRASLWGTYRDVLPRNVFMCIAGTGDHVESDATRTRKVEGAIVRTRLRSICAASLPIGFKPRIELHQALPSFRR